MRKVVLFIAMSLDGYIADRSGGVNWLTGHGNDEENIDTYSIFIKDVDTVIMGWNTYHQITTELSPDNWIYDDLHTYVITHHNCPSTDNIQFTGESPAKLVQMLKDTDGKAIWICGGSSIVHQLLREDLIDTFYISVIPTLLGSGIRLFPSLDQELKLRLVKTQTYNGITDLVYEHRQADSGS